MHPLWLFCITNKQTKGYAVQHTTALPPYTLLYVSVHMNHDQALPVTAVHKRHTIIQSLHLDIYCNKYSVSDIKLSVVRRALQHYNTTALQHYKTIELQHYYTTALLHYSTTALQHLNATTMQHYKTTKLQQYRTTALMY
jgi:hypothetical protein